MSKSRHPKCSTSARRSVLHKKLEVSKIISWAFVSLSCSLFAIVAVLIGLGALTMICLGIQKSRLLGSLVVCKYGRCIVTVLKGMVHS